MVIGNAVQWLKARLQSIPPHRRLLAIVVLGMLLLGTLIVLDEMVIRGGLLDLTGPIRDVPIYRERTQTVLDGKWLYRDLQIESPPLIVYLMLPPQIAGGSDLAYEVYFSIFIMFTACALYLGLRRWDDLKAFQASLLFLVLPFGTVECTIGIQDDSIAIFLFLISVLLALNGRTRATVVSIAVGVWTKMFNVLFYPVYLLNARSKKEALIDLGIIAAVSFLIALPFLIVAPIAFLSFPSYYFLGSGARPTGGVSIWDFLYAGGIHIPGIVLLALSLAAIAGSLYYVHKKRLGILEGSLLVLMAFLVIYARSGAVYFAIPGALLLIWGVDDRRIALRTLVAYGPIITSTAFSASTFREVPVIDFWWSWIVGFALSLTGMLLLVDATRLALKKKPFTSLTRDAREA